MYFYPPGGSNRDHKDPSFLHCYVVFNSPPLCSI